MLVQPNEAAIFYALRNPHEPSRGSLIRALMDTPGGVNTLLWARKYLPVNTPVGVYFDAEPQLPDSFDSQVNIFHSENCYRRPLALDEMK